MPMSGASDFSDADAQAEGLQQLGFTGYEARVYLALLKSFPATAYEVSKQTGLPRANVYGALATLERKAAVQPVNENPVRYVPVAPRLLLGRIGKETASRCAALAHQLVTTTATVATEFVWTLAGDSQVHGKITDIIQHAETHVWIKAAHHALTSHLDELRACAQRGTEVMVILFGDASDLAQYDFGPACKAYLHEGSGSHVAMSESLVTLTRDFQEAMTATTGAKGYGAFTRSKPVVTMAESLIRHEIYLAEIFLHFGDQLEQQFGQALYRLRHKYLPKEHADELGRRIGQLPHAAAHATDTAPEQCEGSATSAVLPVQHPQPLS
jgi:HTH-type transcriptional regulator, sugar sensing transcriptional regulator